MRSAVLSADFSRRIPDPVMKGDGVSRYVLFCRARTMPGDMPLDPNPRGQNIDRRIYRDVARSLLAENGDSGTFHLKNRGLTVIADSVVEDPSDKTKFTVNFDEGDGVVDGGHTYSIIREYGSGAPDDQYVKVEILTGVPETYAVDIADGLNTSVQVQPMSLANLDERFEPIKLRLSGYPYADVITWRENDSGPIDAREIVAIMALFDIEQYPNDESDYPIETYRSKATTLDKFIRSDASFLKVLPILPDVLDLYDTIRKSARTYHNETGGRAGLLAFVEHKQRGKFDFPFTGEQDDYRLSLGALYPMLGAFRYMVARDRATGAYKWRSPDGYEGVKRVWRQVAGQMMRATQATSDDVGRNLMAIGKSRNHWANLHNMVARRVLEDLANKSA